MLTDSCVIKFLFYLTIPETELHPNVHDENEKVCGERVRLALTRLLQETHLKDKHNKMLTFKQYDQQYSAPGTSKARGIAILFHKKLRFNLVDKEIGPLGRYVFVDLYKDKSNFTRLPNPKK